MGCRLGFQLLLQIKLAMVFELTCTQHTLPIDRVCGQSTCGFVMCEACCQDHISRSGHTRMVVLNTTSLDFFAHFTSFIESQMTEWLNRLEHTALPALFYLHPHLEHDLSIPQNLPKSRGLAAKVLLDYRNLMRGNREFVGSFRETQDLFHPEFLKDLYNLIS